MFFFIIIFFFTILVCYSLASKASFLEYRNMKSARQYATSAIVILFVFLATRYDIGRDFQNYLYDYSTFDESDYGFGRRFSFEYMNYIVLLICYAFNTGPVGYFVLTSLILALLFYYIFRDKLFLLPYGIVIFFLCGFYTFAINGIRQGLAIFCIINALTPAKDKDRPDLFHYITYMVIAFFCHNSAMLFVPLYLLFIPGISKVFNSKILMLIALAGFIGNQVGFSRFIPVHLFVDTENIYSKQAMNVILDSNASQLSIAVFINFCVNLIPLFFADKVKNKYPESKVYFVIYTFGIALYYFFGSNLLLIRLSFYLMYFNILVYPYLFTYLRQYKKYNQIPIILNVWYVVYFLGKMGEFWSMQIGRNPSVYGLSL